MPVNLIYGSDPGADEILKGAQDIAQQNISQRQLGIQQYNAQTEAGRAQGQLNLEAGNQALTAQQQAYSNQLEMMRILASLQNSAIGQVGAQAIGVDNNYVPQGNFDSAAAKPVGGNDTSGGGSNPYAGQGWMAGATGADAITNSDEDDSGESLASDDGGD